MITEVIWSLYSYNEWVNQRILDTAAELSKDQFSKDAGPSHGSLRDTFVHTIKRITKHSTAAKPQSC